MEKNSSGDTQFSRVALVAGRPLYWRTPTVSAQKHAERFGELLKWCLRLPKVELGIDPKGVGLILRSIYAQLEEEPLPADLNKRLNSVGATEEETVQWPGDVERFSSHLNQLIELVRLAETRKGYAWVDPEEAGWWVEATIETLAEYATVLEEDRFQELSLELVNRHRCTLFAPSDGSDLLEPLTDLEQLKGSMEEEEYQSFIEGHRNLRADISDYRRSDVYFSWQLTNFVLSQSNLVNISLLALWSDWPSSTVRWAPPCPEDLRENPSLAPHEAASLLEDVLGEKFGGLFKAVRKAFNIGQALPELNSVYKSQSPVFYFAEPTDPPEYPEAYAREWGPAIYPLVKKCLASKDPLADEVAWGVLEQDLAALRREINGDGGHFSRYLLLPVDSGSFSGQELEKELERDLAHLTHHLSSLEFSYNDAVPNIYAADIEPIQLRHEARQPLWKRTLEDLKSQMADSLNLLPGLGRSDAAKVYEEFEKFGELQIRVEHRLEEGRVELDEANEKLVSHYQGKTEEYLGGVAFSPLSRVEVRSLRDALLNPFAFGYLGRLLQKSEEQTDRLKSDINLIRTLQNRVSAVLGNADQRARDHLAYRTTVLGAALGVLALFSLAEFVPGVQLGGENAIDFPGWLGPLSQLLDSFLLVNIARSAMIGVGVLVVVLLVRLFLRDLLSIRRQTLFGIEVQRLRNLVDESNRFYEDNRWEELEQEDNKATQLLCELWGKAERAGGKLKQPLRNLFRWSTTKRFWSARIAGWLRRGRYLRYRTDLFILCPNEITLPRTLCTFQYKSASLCEEERMFSRQDFENSLKKAGFKDHEIERLDDWLSENQEEIREMDVRGFAEVLKERGVTAVPQGNPQGRTPERWEGSLEQGGEPAAAAT